MKKEKKAKMTLRDLEIQNKAVKLGALGMLVLSTVFYILELVILDCHNYGWYSILSVYCMFVYGYKAYRSPKSSYWFISVIWLLTTVVCIINYVTHRF